MLRKRRYSGWAIFLVDRHGNLVNHHSTFLSGGAAQAAGEALEAFAAGGWEKSSFDPVR